MGDPRDGFTCNEDGTSFSSTSKSLEKQYLGVNEEVRSLYFKAHGTYASDTIIRNWYNSIDLTSTGGHNTDGSKTSFYDIPSWVKDVDDLAEHWGLKGDEFNCLKAIVGISLGARHSGTSPKRDANKLLHYSTRIVARLDKETK